MESESQLIKIIQFLGLFFFGGLAVWIGLNMYYYYISGLAVIDVDNNCPVALIGGGGERIYLPYGMIYALRNNLEKEYSIVASTLHVTSETFAKLICFDSPEEADALGFVPDKYVKDYDGNPYRAPRSYRIASN